MSIYSIIKRTLKIILYGFALILCITLIPIVTGLLKCTAHINSIIETPYTESTDITKAQASIKDYHRPVSSSYLIFPEWYIVYSGKEYARYLKHHSPSGFPYFSAIEQYWCGYKTVWKLTSKYPFNRDDHIMLLVIGVSFSVEYTIKGLYENSIGRATEWLSANKPVEEDRYAQKVAEEYANFVPFRPWFEFPFSQCLGQLWSNTSWYGSNMIRKWERKIVLSAEYSVKTVYAWLIGLGSRSTLGAASDYIYATIQNSPDAQNTDIHKIKTISNNMAIISIPHEQPFTNAVTKLADTQANFIDIAGNHDILLTVIVPRDWSYTGIGRALFSMPILTEPALKRVAIQAPVKSLLPIISGLQHSGIVIEHLYDY
jgi:hypothetical protein